jgi:uncharacterized membrane protein
MTSSCGRDYFRGVFLRALTKRAAIGESVKQLGLGVVFFWFLIGIAHFTFTDFEVRMVPPYIPWPYAVVIASGVFELIGAAGLLWKFTRRSAGIGLFLLTIAVTPANFYMLQHPERFDFPYWALVVRLPFQAALLALIAWSTFAGPRKVASDTSG